MQFYPTDYHCSSIKSKYYEKEEKELIRISNQTSELLNKKYGVMHGENGISHTHGHYKKYYLCESEYNLRSLLKIDSTNGEAKKLLKAIEERKKKNK